MLLIAGLRGGGAMVASIGKIVSPSQGVSYYERDGLLRQGCTDAP